MSNTNQILAPPIMFHDNFKAFTGTLFWGLLPVEIEEHILYLLRLMYVGELNRMLLYHTDEEEFNPLDRPSAFERWELRRRPRLLPITGGLTATPKNTTMNLVRWKTILQSRTRAIDAGKYWAAHKGQTFGKINKNTFVSKLHGREGWGNDAVDLLHNDSGFMTTSRMLRSNFEYVRTEGTLYKGDSILKYYQYNTENIESYSNSLYIMKYSHHTSLARLKEHAKELGIKGFSKFKESNKAELISKIYKVE